MTSHDQTGDTIRDARARGQERDAHDDIRNAECVSDDRHLGDSMGREVKKKLERQIEERERKIDTNCAYHPHHKVGKDGNPDGGEDE